MAFISTGADQGDLENEQDVVADEGLREALVPEQSDYGIDQALATTFDPEGKADQISTVLSDWMADSQRLSEVLGDLSPEQINAVTAAFEERYGSTLSQQISQNLSGAEQEAALELIGAETDTAARMPSSETGRSTAQKSESTETPEPEAHPPERAEAEFDPSARADKLYEAMDGWGTDEDAIYEALDGLSPEQVEQVKQYYKEHYKNDLVRELDSELSSSEMARARELLSRNQAAADARALHEAMDGLGTNEQAIFDTLEGKSPEEIAGIKAEYEKRYGNLERDLKSEMDGSDLARAEAALDADPAALDAAKLREAMAGMGTDEAAINQILDGKSPEQIAAIREAYNEKFGDLDKDLRSELDSNEYARVQGLLENDPAKEDAARLKEAMDGLGTNEAEIYEVLDGKSPEEIEAVKEAYRELSGRELEADLRSEFSGAEEDRALALLDGDQASAIAAELREAMAGLGTDEDKIYELLDGKSEEEREAIKAAYREAYGRDLDADIESEMSGSELEKADQLLQDGKVTDATALRDAMEGVGTDEQAIKDILAGKSADEIKAIKAEYKEKYGEDLEERLDSELSGTDQFEVEILMRGEPETLEERLEIMELRAEHHKPGMISGVFTERDEIMVENAEKARELYDKAMEDGEITDEERAEIEKYLGFAETDVEKVKEENIGGKVMDVVQAGIDVVGLIPVVGEIADGLNGVIYTARGKAADAALSFAAMVPLAGWAATGTKWGKKAIGLGKKADDAAAAIKAGKETLEGAGSRAGREATGGSSAAGAASTPPRKSADVPEEVKVPADGPPEPKASRQNEGPSSSSGSGSGSNSPSNNPTEQPGRGAETRRETSDSPRQEPPSTSKIDSPPVKGANPAPGTEVPYPHPKVDASELEVNGQLPDGIVLMDPKTVRTSQERVSKATSDDIPLEELSDRMRDGGFKAGDAAKPDKNVMDVVEMRDGGITSVDNRRLIAVEQADVPIVVRKRKYEDPLSRKEAKRLQVNAGTVDETGNKTFYDKFTEAGKERINELVRNGDIEEKLVNGKVRLVPKNWGGAIELRIASGRNEGFISKNPYGSIKDRPEITD